MYVLGKFGFQSSSNDSSDDDNKFYAKSTVWRQPNSPCAASESDREELNGNGRMVASPKIRGLNAASQAESADRNTKPKRSRGQEDGVDTPAKRKKTSNKSAVQATAMQTEQTTPYFYSKTRKVRKGSAPMDSKDDCTRNRTAPRQMLHETKATASGKNPAKKMAPYVWSARDEISFANTLLACSRGGRVDISAVHERMNQDLEGHFNTMQVYGKMRRMRSKYRNICAEMEEEGVGFTHNTPHQENLFQIWSKIWGIRRGTELSRDNECPKKNPRGMDGPNGKGMGNGEGDADVGTNGGAVHVKEDHPKKETDNFFGPSGDVSDLLQRQSTAMMDKFKVSVQNMLDDVQLKTASLIDSSVRHAVANANSVQPLGQFESGTILETGLCSILSTRMKELTNEVYSVKEFPRLNVANTQALQQKWHEQLVRELKVFSERLELLQDECKMCLKDLETRVDCGRS